MSGPVLVVGVGSASDPADRAGILVAEAVARVAPTGVDVTTVTDPARLVDIGTDRDALVLVDAATRPDGVTADVLVLDLAELPPTSPGRSLGTHGLGVLDSLALGRRLGRVPAHTRVVAVLVDPTNRSPVTQRDDGGLAAVSVEAAVAAVGALLRDLTRTAATAHTR